MKTITLKLNSKEERILLQALRTYQHLLIGNLGHAVEPLVHAINAGDPDNNPFLMDGIALRESFTLLQSMVTGSANGGPSITNPGVSPDARIARRVECQIRGDKTGEQLYTENGGVRT